MVVEILSTVIFNKLGKIEMVDSVLVGVDGDIIVRKSDNLVTDFGGDIDVVEI